MDGEKKSDRLIQAAEALADGSTPDWDDLLAPGADTDRLEQLRNLEQIALAFQTETPRACRSKVRGEESSRYMRSATVSRSRPAFFEA